MFFKTLNDQNGAGIKAPFHMLNTGAEYVLPWVIDSYFSAIGSITARFSTNELHVLLNAKPGFALAESRFNSAAFIREIIASCLKNLTHKRYGVTLEKIEKKLQQLNERQTFMIAMWIHAFWQASPQKDHEQYISRSK